MKQVTITRDSLYAALATAKIDCSGKWFLLCNALGLTDAPKRKVKLLAWVNTGNGDLLWRSERPPFDFFVRCPSEDREVEVECGE